jgi:lipoprotein
VPQCIEKSGGNVHTKTLPFRNLQTSAALAACAGTKLHVKNLFFTLETCFFEKIN